jgi:nucleoside diphosphate kinase
MSFAPLIFYPELLPLGGVGVVLSRLSLHANLEWTGACLTDGPLPFLGKRPADSTSGPAFLVIAEGPDAASSLAHEVAHCEALMGGKKGISCAATEEEALEWIEALRSPASLPSPLRHGVPPVEERTLVLVKPDNFRGPSARPGMILDNLERAGLRMVGVKLHHFRPSEAKRFYEPVLPFLEEFQGGRALPILAEWADSTSGLTFSEEDKARLEKSIGSVLGRRHWEKLVSFMTGLDAESTCQTSDRPGPAKVLAVIYQGVDAVAKIRALQGSTDPAKALPGTVRGELARSVMSNAMHASDSVANAAREMALLRWDDHPLECLFSRISRRPHTADSKPTLTH